MAILPILQFPDRGLRIKAAKVAAADDISPGLIENMFETMYAEPGVGLAATQINVHQQIIVIDVSDSADQPHVLINPVVLARSGEISIQEGCLSVPGVREWVPRAARIRISALDRHWRPFELEADDLLAICIQHEIDHLNGILFIDYLSPLKRQCLQEKVEKNAKKLARASAKRQ